MRAANLSSGSGHAYRARLRAPLSASSEELAHACADRRDAMKCSRGVNKPSYLQPAPVEQLDTRPFYTTVQGEAGGAFRFKLLELSPDGDRLRLYRGDVFPGDG